MSRLRESLLFGDMKFLLAVAVPSAPVILAGIVVPELLAIIAAGVGVVVYGTLLLKRSAYAGIIIFALAMLDRPIISLLAGSPAMIVGQYGDDAALGAAFIACLATLRFHPSKLPRGFWLGSMLFMLAGVSGALISHANPEGFTDGTWLALKLPISIFVMTQLDWTARARSAFLWVLMTVFVIQTGVELVEIVNPTLVHTYFRDAGSHAVRLGESGLKGIFGQPVQAAAFAMFVAVVLFCAPVNQRLRWFGLIAVAAAASGLRVKTLANIVVLAILRTLFSAERSTRYLAPAVGILVIGGVLAGGADLILARTQEVLESDTSARNVLLINGAKIALDYFPFGTGFGSYASSAAADHYSPVWSMYGMSHTYGFRKDRVLFATDSSLATVVGESGFLGTVGMIIIVASLGMYAYRMARNRFGISWQLTAMVYLAVVLVDAAASPRLFDGFALAGCGILLALAQQSESDADPPTADTQEAA